MSAARAPLPAGCREPLRHLLLACADTKLLLGYHYGEWTFGPPALEAAVACCSLAQSEFGHARLLHGMLRDLFDDDPDALIERRPAGEYASIEYLHHPIAHWPGLVAANYVVDLALTRVLQSLAASGFKPLAMGLDKMLEEERYHGHHGRGWFRTLARRAGSDGERLTVAASEALATVLAWLGPAGEAEDDVLVGAGLKQVASAALARDIGDAVLAEGAAAGLTVRPGAGGFEGWTAATRRCGAGGPDAAILEHLRGVRNEVFKAA